MRSYSLWRMAILMELAFSFAAAGVTRAQQSSIILANPRLQGADFSFEILGTDPSSCVVQSSDRWNGVWTDLVVSPSSPFVVRVTGPSRYFRVHCGDSYSTN